MKRKHKDILTMAAERKVDNQDEDVNKCFENYILVDTGAYLTHKKYSRDLDSVLGRAKESGVQKILSVSMTLANSKDALRLTRLYPGTVYCTVGVHPHEAKLWTNSSYNDLRALAENAEVVAIGECGLDYNRDFSPQALQREAFQHQVKLACELKKPLYLHERDAHDDMLNILRKYEGDLPGGVVHCFTGTVEQAKVYISMGFHIGITGYICKDKTDNGIRTLLQQNVLPISRLLVESSAPYMFANTQGGKLSPEVKKYFTKRSLTFLDRYCTFQRNEPCSLPALVEMVAGTMEKDTAEVALATAFNSLRLFGLSA